MANARRAQADLLPFELIDLIVHARCVHSSRGIAGVEHGYIVIILNWSPVGEKILQRDVAFSEVVHPHMQDDDVDFDCRHLARFDVLVIQPGNQYAIFLHDGDPAHAERFVRPMLDLEIDVRLVGQ